MSTTENNSFKKKLTGTVVSVSGEKSIVVKVGRKFKHPLYSKFLNRTKKYHAHDEAMTAKAGDMVTIVESRPHSKLKKWELFKVN